ncbi:MAG: hypothetical protein M0D55_05705 [Elusimicrobiota bacterium]|nr:MAG: hypothetical protein M0D55_05705 [Elusimicrobiota bacterium]
MHRVRNAVIIIILCIIGAYTVKQAPQLALNMNDSQLNDAVAGGPSRGRRSGPKLTLASGTGDEMRDAVAGHAVGTPNNGNTLGDVAPPPRGMGQGGFGPQANNPSQNFNPPPENLSPSTPEETNNECSDCQYR